MNYNITHLKHTIKFFHFHNRDTDLFNGVFYTTVILDYPIETYEGNYECNQYMNKINCQNTAKTNNK